MTPFKKIIAYLQTIIIKLLVMLIRAYQLIISPLLGSNCRFYPSCSQYTMDAIKGHGLINGLFLSVRRVLRCHPYSKGGIDPVPEKRQHNG